MFRRFSTDFAIFSMVIDSILVALSLKLALSLGPYLHAIFPFINQIYGPLALPGPLYAILPCLWVLNLLIHSVYDARRNFRVVDELTSLVTGSAMASISVFGLLFLTYREVSRQVLLVAVVAAFLFTCFFRVVYRCIFRAQAGRGVEHRNVLIAGAGPVGMEAAGKIANFKNLGLALQGFLDDRPVKTVQGYPVLGKYSDARRLILENEIDDLVIALPRSAFEHVNQMVAELRDLPVKVWVIPDYFALALNRAHIDELAGVPMIDLRAPALGDYQRMVKRAFDTCLTLLVMPVALPVMGLVAICIRLDTPGPIFFRQKRVGENRRIFEMIKFRSMVVNAEQNRACVEHMNSDGKIIQDKRQKDPRVTRVGAFLRKTSLDELPQLFNVLKGEMSLVGPRPELPYMVKQYEPWQQSRFAIPQGITGWWQVNGRSDKPMAANTDEDIYYVKNYSIWLDIQILIKTVIVVLRRKGAY